MINTALSAEQVMQKLTVFAPAADATGYIGPTGRNEVGASGRQAEWGTAMNEGESGQPAQFELGNRRHAQGERRKQRTTVSFTDTEWDRIVAAAALAKKRPGAWVAEAAHDAARWRLRGLPTGRDALEQLGDQVRSLRNVLANIGGNLNDVARHANTTHEVRTIRSQAETVLGMVRRVVGRADETLGEVVGLLQS